MKYKIRRSNIILGLICLLISCGSVIEYFRTKCVTPYLYEPVCGQSAVLILSVYILVGILGIYLIIREFWQKNWWNSENHPFLNILSRNVLEFPVSLVPICSAFLVSSAALSSLSSMQIIAESLLSALKTG